MKRSAPSFSVGDHVYVVGGWRKLADDVRLRLPESLVFRITECTENGDSFLYEIKRTGWRMWIDEASLCRVKDSWDREGV